MACIIYTIKPAVSRKVGHAGACVLGDCVILYPMVDTRIFLIDAYLQVIDFYVCWFYCLFRSQLLHTRPNSSVSRVSPSWSKDRGFDPVFSSKIFFLQKMSEIIFPIMVPIVNNHILSESLWFDIMAGGHNVLMYIICSIISHMGL